MDHVVLYLPLADDDGEVPRRRVLTFSSSPVRPGWEVRVPPERHAAWLAQAVPSVFEGGDKRTWRLALRFAQVRNTPEGLAVNAAVLGNDVVFERID